MYRQVYVNEKQRSLQKILWRSNLTHPLRTYSLNTVTYGTASAPFLAIRCLVELAKVNIQKLRKSYGTTYVDDLITGSDSVLETIDILTT